MDAVKFLFGILLAALFFSNNVVLFELTYVFIFFTLIIYNFLSKSAARHKILLSSVYLMIMIFQSVYNNMVIFAENNDIFASLTGRIIGLALVPMPFIVNKLISEIRGGKSYLPSIQDLSVFTFNELVENVAAINKTIKQGQKSMSKKNIDVLIKDLPRHNSFRYINKGSLTDEYFNMAYKTLDDLKVYIIISNTGSPASEIISMFTKKQYNHASLSFDRELKTIISYNGGENIYPPGLNMEMIKYFNKKEESSIIVYSLPISVEKKKMIIEKIKEINAEGNAYNLFGLALKFSFKPNIMFCSQFVYKMLKHVGLNYFDKKEGQIKPTDLIELDYDRNLNYEYKIKFNEI
ncbi:MAG: hypothetical protein LBK73_11050 [Treponema sp.]|nr:hypothetical protein [Treponema sp.]